MGLLLYNGTVLGLGVCYDIAIIGGLSGKTAKVLSSKQSITFAMLGITVSLLLPAFFVEGSLIVFVISMMLFSGSFAFMYAPMLDTCINTIPKEKAGTAIGFYNLILNVAVSIGITYTAAMIDTMQFSQILFILAFIAIFALILFGRLVVRLAKVE